MKSAVTMSCLGLVVECRGGETFKCKQQGCDVQLRFLRSGSDRSASQQA
jgi:hypothetical protein